MPKPFAPENRAAIKHPESSIQHPASSTLVLLPRQDLSSEVLLTKEDPSSSSPIQQSIQEVTLRSGQRMRNGKIARLPKLERDLVNKLLHNHVPYSKIVWALEERGITVTERNISNWRTRGGYKEWCAEQENQLRLAHHQDHLP